MPKVSSTLRSYHAVSKLERYMGTGHLTSSPAMLLMLA